MPGVIKILFISCLLFFQNHCRAFSSDTDSLPQAHDSSVLVIYSFATISLLSDKNWKKSSEGNFSFSGKIDFTGEVKTQKRSRVFNILSEIDYVKYRDSTWVKNEDNFEFTSTWVNNPLSDVHSSFSLALKTQMTDTWEYSFEDEKQHWTSGPFSPGSFITGYGITKNLPNRSSVNFSLASVKFKTLPRTPEYETRSDFTAKSNRIYYFWEFGMNIRALLITKFSKNIKWINRTNLFADKINYRSSVLNFQNTLSITLLKYCELKFDSKINYDYLFSDKLQFSQGVRFGFVFEK